MEDTWSSDSIYARWPGRTHATLNASPEYSAPLLVIAKQDRIQGGWRYFLAVGEDPATAQQIKELDLPQTADSWEARRYVEAICEAVEGLQGRVVFAAPAPETQP